MVTATSLYSDGDLTPAENIVRAFLLRHGNHPEAMRLLAKIGMARGVLDDAELLLEAALVLAPDHRAARLDYAQVLVQRHKYRDAGVQAAQLLAQLGNSQAAGTIGSANSLIGALGNIGNDAQESSYMNILNNANPYSGYNLPGTLLGQSSGVGANQMGAQLPGIGQYGVGQQAPATPG